TRFSRDWSSDVCSSDLNPEQEEAEEIINVEYKGAPLEIGFNVSYLVDVLTVLASETVQMTLSDSNSSVLIQASDNNSSLYVVMRLEERRVGKECRCGAW